MNIFLKTNGSRLQKINEAFTSLKDAGIPAFFPRGKRQAQIVAISYCKIGALLQNDLPSELYAKMLLCYVDIMSAIGATICRVPDDGNQNPFYKQLAATLMGKYPLFMGDENKAKTIIAYTAANMHNPLYAYDSSDNKLFIKYEEWIKSVDLLNALDALSTHADQTETGFYFENVEELAIYGKIISHGDSVLWLKGDKYLNLYQKGYALYEQGEFLQAISALKESLKFNPVGIHARFEMAECYIRLKKYKQATDILYTMTRFLIKSEDQARFYRRIGYINSEKKKYLCAAACYAYSLWFYPHPSVEREFSYLSSKCSVNIASMKENPLLILKNFNVPILALANENKEQLIIEN